MLVKNDLFDYENRYIFQDSDFFKFSLDSILLAEFINLPKTNKIILDMCAGNMVVPLIISKYTSCPIIGFEIQPSVYELGKKSVEYNNLSSQLKIINDDVNNIDHYYSKSSFDIIVCNPPYFKFNNNKMINKTTELQYARHEIALNLENVFLIANKYLKNKGELYLVHRSDRVDEIINLGYKYQVNVKKLQFVSTKKGASPRIVLAKCVRNSNEGIKIGHELCIEGVKTYKNIFREEK